MLFRSAEDCVSSCARGSDASGRGLHEAGLCGSNRDRRGRERLNAGDDGLQGTRQHLHGGSRCVTTFVTRLGEKGKERTGKHRINGTLQASDIATNCGETVAIASILKRHAFPLLISGPYVRPLYGLPINQAVRETLAAESVTGVVTMLDLTAISLGSACAITTMT